MMTVIAYKGLAIENSFLQKMENNSDIYPSDTLQQIIRRGLFQIILINSEHLQL